MEHQPEGVAGRDVVPVRFHSLDALRGIAALAVVFWHWQHFFYNGTARGDFAKLRQPLYEVFFVFYEKGWMAVDIFFSLSGFIFFWLYSDRIAARRIGFGEFWMLRLSRLYPLHLVTLLFVAVVQWELRNRTGSFFVYPSNDAYHFVINLLFASGWRTAFGDTFNAPVWSVSVEIFLYLAFFVICLAGRPRWVRLLALVLLGALLKFYVPLGRGIYSFFLGAAAYYVYEMLVARKLTRRSIKPLWTAVLVGWVAIALILKLGSFGSDPSGTFDSGFLARATNLAVTGILMPMTILALALSESVLQVVGKRVSFLGDISYSSYMLYFPLQLAVVSIAGSQGAPPELFYSEFALVGFFLILILLSLLSYNFFERPVQEMIRSRWRAAKHHLDRHNDEVRASIETPAHGLGSAELVDTTALLGEAIGVLRADKKAVAN